MRACSMIYTCENLAAAAVIRSQAKYRPFGVTKHRITCQKIAKKLFTNDVSNDIIYTEYFYG